MAKNSTVDPNPKPTQTLAPAWNHGPGHRWQPKTGVGECVEKKSRSGVVPVQRTHERLFPQVKGVAYSVPGGLRFKHPVAFPHGPQLLLVLPHA